MEQFSDHVASLVTQMVDEFQAKKQRKNISSRIRRGRSRTSSNDFEEYLANFFVKLLPNDINLLIDYPLSYKRTSGQRIKTIYPDIILIRGNSLIGIVEAKIDVGYLRGHWATRRKRDLSRLVSDGIATIDETSFKVPKHLSFGCILLSEKNHTKRLPRLRKTIGDVFALISKDYAHPNDDSLGEKGIKSAYITAISKDIGLKNEWNRLRIFMNTLQQTN